MQQQNIKIVRASLDDIEIIETLGRQTCIETFSTGNSDEDMRKYLDESFNPEILSDEIYNPNSEFYLAYSGNVAVGYLKINLGDAQTELQDCNSLEVQRIYVIKEYYGLKVGQALFDKAVEIALKHDVEFIWLGVWERNFRAVGFYKKNGFVKFSEHAFKFGDDMQTDIMMKKEISSL